MTDQEKLVRLIDEAADITPVSHGGQISYYLDSEKIADHLIAHGVTVREMQKPLTVEEVKTERAVWIEDVYISGKTDIFPALLLYGVNGDSYRFIYRNATHMEEREIDLEIDCYGEDWRCWAEKPTEEERKAAEWE